MSRYEDLKKVKQIGYDWSMTTYITRQALYKWNIKPYTLYNKMGPV
jgi:hypothetical protein